jgi:hypothetical protein
MLSNNLYLESKFSCSGLVLGYSSGIRCFTQSKIQNDSARPIVVIASYQGMYVPFVPLCGILFGSGKVPSHREHVNVVFNTMII